MKMVDSAPPPPLSLPLSHEGREEFVCPFVGLFRPNGFCNTLGREEGERAGCISSVIFVQKYLTSPNHADEKPSAPSP